MHAGSSPARPGRGASARRVGRGVVGAVGVLTALTLAACSAPGSSGGGATTTAAGPSSVSTSIGSAPVSLTLYDGQGLKAIDQALIAAFTKQYPNVTITGTWDPDNVTTQNQPRQLASETPPDLIRVISVTGGTKNGLLTNLDPYATAYGWDKLPKSELSQFREENGVAGSGSLFAKPSGFTMTGLYYNKKLATQIGMTTPPTTLADLEALFAKAKAANLIPLVTSNTTGATMLTYQLMLNTSMGVDKVSQWVFNAPGATVDNADSVAAAQQLVDWVNKGYFPDGINGLDPNTSMGMFTSGKGVFYPSGNWDATALDKAMAGNIGFFTMPPFKAGAAPAAMSDAATAFGIPAKSTHKDAAAAFLNFLSSDEARQIVLDNGFMPTGSTDQKPPTTPAGSVLGDVHTAFDAIAQAGNQVPFIQNATPAIANKAWNPESQLLVAGKETPQQFVSNVQKEYEDELK